MRVEEVCSRRVVHARPSCTLHEAAVLMRDYGVRALLVADTAGTWHVKGVVTERDIVIHGLATKGVSPEVRVDNVMTPGVIGIDRAASISDALRLMLTHGVRRLVVTRDRKVVVGMVSMDDAIRALGTDWALLAGIFRRDREQEVASGPLTQLYLQDA